MVVVELSSQIVLSDMSDMSQNWWNCPLPVGLFYQQEILSLTPSVSNMQKVLKSVFKCLTVNWMKYQLEWLLYSQHDHHHHHTDQRIG